MIKFFPLFFLCFLCISKTISQNEPTSITIKPKNAATRQVFKGVTGTNELFYYIPFDNKNAVEIIKNNGEFRQFSNMKKNSMYDIRMYVLYRERSNLYEIINSRVDHMVKSGLVDEVRSLLNDGLDKSCQSMKAIGYRQIISYLEGEYDLNTAIELIKRDSRRYAKRQLTWFRRYEDAVWINVDSMNTEQISDFIIKEAMIDK